MVRIALIAAALFATQVLSSRRPCGSEKGCNEFCAQRFPHFEHPKCVDYRAHDQSCSQCQDTTCIASGPFHNPFTGGYECCPEGSHYDINHDIQKGKCCEDDKFLSVDKPSGAMGCCPKGDSPPHKLFVDPKTKKSACCPSDALGYLDEECIFPDPEPRPDPRPNPRPDPRPDPRPTPDPNPDVCGENLCPPDDYDMGMEYGKCYRLISRATGLPLALRDTKKNDYHTDRENDLWQFRVCHSSQDCTPGGTLKAGQKFVLNDVMGKPGDGPWFMCSQSPHFGPCKVGDGDKVTELSARKWCTSGECGICLSASPFGLGRVCPGNHAIGYSPDKNERQCVLFFVQEMPCLADYPILGGEDMAKKSFVSFDDDEDSIREL